MTSKGRASKIIVLAASTQGLADAQAKYQRLATSYPDLLRDSAQYYRDYLNRTLNLTLPDAQLQQAYDWSRISTVQGLVTNPYLGTGWSPDTAPRAPANVRALPGSLAAIPSGLLSR